MQDNFDILDCGLDCMTSIQIWLQQLPYYISCTSSSHCMLRNVHDAQATWTDVCHEFMVYT